MTDRHPTDVADHRPWLPPLLLLLSSVGLAAIPPAFQLVSTSDGSTPVAAIGTAWLAMIPAAVALTAILRNSEIGLAAIAGAGVVAVGRALADLGLLLSPDAVLRPELFGVASVEAFPLTPTWAAALPLAGDLFAIAALSVAGGRVLDGYEPPMLGPDEPDRPRALRANPFSWLGLVAVVLIITASLGVLYNSPVPVVRPLGVADIGLFGAAGAALGGLLLCLLVVVAAALPSASARGLVLGAGAASAVPPAVAILGAGQPSAMAWIGLAGALGLAAVGLLLRAPEPAARKGPAITTDDAATNEPATNEPATNELATNEPATNEPATNEPATNEPATNEPATNETDEIRTVPVWRGIALGLLAIGVAGCALLAYLKPQATADLTTAGTSFDAAGAGFLAASIVLLCGGVAALLPPIAPFARRWLGLSWLPVTVALLSSLEFTSSSIWVSSAVFTNVSGVQRSTGSWWGVAAVSLAMVVAIAAPVLSARIRDGAVAGVDPIDDQPQRNRVIVGAVLSGLIVIAYAMPVYKTGGNPAAALFVAGSRIDGYGAWVSVLALVAASWIACRHHDRAIAAAILVSAAAVVACRIVLLPAVRHQVDFTVRTGFYVSAALVVALLVAAAALWWIMGRPPSAAAVPPPAARRFTAPQSAAQSSAPRSAAPRLTAPPSTTQRSAAPRSTTPQTTTPQTTTPRSTEAAEAPGRAQSPAKAAKATGPPRGKRR